MTFPNRKDIEIPLLKALKAAGGNAEPRKIYPMVAKEFPELTEKEQNQRLENFPNVRKWWNSVQWARQKLVEKGQIDGSTHGVWKITKEGLARLVSREDSSGGFKRAVSTKAGKKSPKGLTAPADVRESDVTLRDLLNYNVAEVKRRLITELKGLSPRGFEKFCTVLLGQLGYEELSITKRGADGGIDGYGNFRQGVVRIKSAFQAKRWSDSSIGQPVVDQLRGAIQGVYDHGVILTTSQFSRQAQEASVKKGAITILLLDGNAIADLMIEKGLGVRKQPVYLSDIDDEFFDFDDS